MAWRRWRGAVAECVLLHCIAVSRLRTTFMKPDDEQQQREVSERSPNGFRNEVFVGSCGVFAGT